MKEEVVILNGDPEEVFKDGKIPEKYTEEIKFANPILNGWRRKSKSPIKSEPQFIAIHVNGTKAIWVIREVDIENSDLRNGEIAWRGKPIRVYIPIRYKKNFTLEGNVGTTFTKLLTHKSTNDIKTL